MIRAGVAALFLGAVAALIVLGPSLDEDERSLPGFGQDVASIEDPETVVEEPAETTTTTVAPIGAVPLPGAPPIEGPAPDLVELDGWLNTEATSFDAFDGQVRIVQFWTFGCHNCKATIPYLQEIYADAGPRGLEIIGVHAPEFDHEADRDNIVAASAELGVTWPIALDTDKTNFRAWQGNRRFWPRTYVIDQNGQIRFDHIGEGDYEELAATVDWLLENGP